MPYTLHWESRGVYKRFSGFVAFADYARSQEKVLSDPRIDEMHWVINDFLAVEGYSVTSDDAEYAAAFNRGASLSNPRLRIAYITVDARLVLLVKFASPLSHYPLRVFPTLEAAREWVLASPPTKLAAARFASGRGR